MTEYTPTTISIRNRYAIERKSVDGNPWDDSMAEFDRWLAAHDQGIRDAVKPPAMTAREHQEAAFDGAFPVQENQVIPAHTPLFSRDIGDGGATLYLPDGLSTPRIQTSSSGCEYRTLDPLPPLIPEGTPALWASTEDCDVRRVLALACNRSIPADRRIWRDGDGDTYRDAELIDPVPIHKEER